MQPECAIQEPCDCTAKQLAATGKDWTMKRAVAAIFSNNLQGTHNIHYSAQILAAQPLNTLFSLPLQMLAIQRASRVSAPVSSVRPLPVRQCNVTVRANSSNKTGLAKVRI